MTKTNKKKKSKKLSDKEEKKVISEQDSFQSKTKLKTPNNKTNNNQLNENKNFSISKFKEEMTKEMSNSLKNLSTNNQRIYENSSNLISYEKQHAKYITEKFKSSTVSLINQICSLSKTIPNDLRNNYPLHSLLIKVTRELMLNDLELVYLSLYFDNFGWKNNNIDVMDNLIITALSVKKYLNSDTENIEDYLSKTYPNILSAFNIWFKSQKDFKANISFSPRLVNERYDLLTRTYNTYCKTNYIDYNESVDRILQMSLPYNEGGRNNSNILINEKREKIKSRKTKQNEKEKGKKKIKKNFIVRKTIENSKSNQAIQANELENDLLSGLSAQRGNISYNINYNSLINNDLI
jgi:hypothetical protein